jgi:uncharacterized protein
MMPTIPAMPPAAGVPRRRSRRCVASRTTDDRSRMVRFVLAPDGTIVADVAGRLPGRGVWLSASRDVVNRAVARNLFAKAMRTSVRVDPELAATVERALAVRCLDLLGLARRAGQIVLGFDQVRAALAGRGVAVLIAANDGAADGRRRLRALAPRLPLLAAFGREELGAALGRENTVHAALAPGGLARRLIDEAQRLEGFRPGSFEARTYENLPPVRRGPDMRRNDQEEAKSS